METRVAQLRERVEKHCGICLEDEPGRIAGVFATLDEPDRSNDVILKGSIGNQDVLIGGLNHNLRAGVPPIGRGRVYEEGNKALFEAEIWTDRPDAADAYDWMQRVKDIIEVSWGFRVLKAYESRENDKWLYNIQKTDIWEVSPVCKGAGNSTGITMMKSMDLPSTKAIVAAMQLQQQAARLRAR